jgi:hypothetical protein
LTFDQWGYSAKANLYRDPTSFNNGNLQGFNDANYNNPTYWNAYYSNLQGNGAIKASDIYAKLTAENIRYADQIPPFRITVSMANEYGAMASMALYGVQIINEGSGMSIDDLVTEKAVTFEATDISPLKSIEDEDEIFTKF